MKKNYHFVKWVFLLFAGISMGSCVDSDYDLGKDMDMTMGFGTEGLALKLGHTERIFLRDVLKLEDSEMLDTLSTSMYYLVKDGNANVKVHVDPIDDINLNDVNLFTSPVVEATDTDIPVDEGREYSNEVEGFSNLEISINNIPTEVKSIRRVTISGGNAKMNLSLKQPVGSDFRFRALNNVRINFPDYIYSSQFKPGTHTFVINRANINSSVVSNIVLPIDSIVLTGEDMFGIRVQNGMIDLTEKIDLVGDVTIVAARNFTLPQNSSVTVELNATLNHMVATSMSGLVDPEIDPTVDPIEISNDLPDFLKDDSVKLEMVNPTIRFHMLGTELPVPLFFSAQAASVKNNITKAVVNLPQGGNANIPAKTDYKFYFYQTGKPFTPEAENITSSQQYQVSNLSSLVHSLPDVINVDLSNRRVHTNQTQLHMIDLGKDYNVNMNYNVYVPFQFRANTCIVYNDSVDDMNSDLKDYQAEGLKVTATAFNTIPLDLDVTLIPYDVNGRDMSDELVVDHAIAKAGIVENNGEPTQTPMIIELTPKTPAVISRLDKLMFRVNAKSVESNEMRSNQYLELKDIRLKLKGQIIGNFN